ncbi:hypothetical protein EC960107_0143, partial [Escherichia coli 96.0107]
MAGITPR